MYGRLRQGPHVIRPLQSVPPAHHSGRDSVFIPTSRDLSHAVTIRRPIDIWPETSKAAGAIPWAATWRKTPPIG